MKKGPMTLQREANLVGWQAHHTDYKVCAKCQGYGISITKSRREYSQCSQCTGTGWKYKPTPTCST